MTQLAESTVSSAMFYRSPDGSWEWMLGTATKQCAVVGTAPSLAAALRASGKAAAKCDSGLMPAPTPVPFSSWGACQSLRCGATWNAHRYDRPPKRCAKCRSPYWNKPRVRSAGNEKERELFLLISAGKAGKGGA